MEGGIEGLITGAEDKRLDTRSYRYKIIQDGTNPNFRTWNECEETIDHIAAWLSGICKSGINSAAAARYAGIAIFQLRIYSRNTSLRSCVKMIVIDANIQSEKSVSNKEVERLFKYKDLETEL